MKFQLVLKQKEFEFVNKMNEEWRKKEIEREKQWKKTEASILQIETKIKNKANELQKREQKIILLEEELKYKINETVKSLTEKDTEILDLKKKYKEEKILLEKEKNSLKL